MVSYNSGRWFRDHRSRKGHLFAATTTTILWTLLLFWSIQGHGSSSTTDVGSVRYVALETYGEEAWNVFCFAAGTTTTVVPQDCCQALRRALGQPPPNTFPTMMKNDESIQTVHEKCVKEVTSLPDASFLHSGAVLVPRFAFFLERDDDMSHQPRQNANHTSRWQRVLPPPVPFLPVLSNRYVWHNEHGQWLDLSATNEVVDHQEDEKKKDDDNDSATATFLQDWYYTTAPPADQDATTYPPAAGWTAHLQSKLSTSGGMHRDLHHIITVESSSTGQHSVSSTATRRISFRMVLQIPSGLFVNVEDLFRMETAGALLSVELMGPITERVIDQEEPTFVSPPHGLLVQITLEIPPTAIIVVAEFVTLLHVRYPLPISRDDPNASSFRLVVVPPPRLLDGRIVHHHDDENDSSDRPDESVRIILSRQGRDNRTDKEDSRPRLLSLWVAAGREEDYTFTLGVTLLVALLGAMVMLRDISQLAKWD